MEFHHRLLAAGLPFGGVVVNRVDAVEPDATADGLAELAVPPLARKVADSVTDNRRLADGDRANLAALRRRLRRKPMIDVPELDDEVHDLAADTLGASSASRAERVDKRFAPRPGSVQLPFGQRAL
jgi:hypothetical protein